MSGALKDILDGLNEKPIRRKVITAWPFLKVLEQVFRQRISRQQQDAHEFLQLVAEKVAEEYHAMERFKKQRQPLAIVVAEGSGEKEMNGIRVETEVDPDPFTEKGMPLEGTLESEIECTKCKFKTKPKQSKFVVLTLAVPHKVSTLTPGDFPTLVLTTCWSQPSATLNECIDGAFTTEYIDDFQCDKCRIQHAISHYEGKRPANPSDQTFVARSIKLLKEALEKDPQSPPPDVPLPPSSPATRSRIAKRTRMSSYPAVVVIHLSRSIYDQYLTSRKNVCKVSFPENLIMGGLIDRKAYKLQCVVTHKGGHDSGHYECFRRQIVYPPPFSTPHPPSAGCSPTSTPSISVTASGTTTPFPPKTATGDDQDKRLSVVEANGSCSPVAPSERTVVSFSTPLSPNSTAYPDDRPSTPSSVKTTTSAAPTLSDRASLPPSPAMTATTTKTNGTIATTTTEARIKKPRAKRNNKWWRISDDKIKEAKTDDVLSQQKEVYLLFYERVREDR